MSENLSTNQNYYEDFFMRETLIVENIILSSYMKINKTQTVKWSKGSGLFCSEKKKKKKKHNCKSRKIKEISSLVKK